MVNISKGNISFDNILKLNPDIQGGGFWHPDGIIYNTSYLPALLNAVSDNKRNIIMVYVDKACINMALNFIEGSIVPFNISNLLVCTSSESSCQLIHNMNVACYVAKTKFKNNSPGKEAAWGTKEYKNKMNIRTDIILQILKLGYNVLHTDADVVFLNDPWPEIDKQCLETCDLASLNERAVYNAGFIYVKATIGSQWLYNETKIYAAGNPNSADQDILNRMIHSGKAKNILSPCFLSNKQFVGGDEYFEPSNHFKGSKDMNDCLVVHNTYIFGGDAKIYRFKEHLMWFRDDNEYYSSTTRKYLSYGNPYHNPNSSYIFQQEILSLKNAFIIGNILNRTVILPKFHCGKNVNASCSLLSVLHVATLNKYFDGKYREHVFLSHPKVPLLSKNAAKLFIHSKQNRVENKIPLPLNSTKGPKDKDILKWFGNKDDTLIEFHSLYEPLVAFEDSKTENIFKNKISKSIVKSDYQQNNHQ